MISVAKEWLSVAALESPCDEERRRIRFIVVIVALLASPDY